MVDLSLVHQIKGVIMSTVTFKGNPIQLAGIFPKIGSTINDFQLTDNALNEIKLSDLHADYIVLNIFPSLDTPTCSNSVRTFNTSAAKLKNCIVLCISNDLPFAQNRFCSTNDIKNVKPLSAFRNHDFARQLGVEITDGPIRGLLARAVIILNAKHEVIYTELVAEIANEPNYEKCLQTIESRTKQ